MIYTCTMNPAIDLFVEMETFVVDEVNRSKYEEYQANGKGINVSIVLKQLGIDSMVLGFLGGFSGQFIKDSLDDLLINNNFIVVDGITRINTFVQSINGEYKVVNRGPEIFLGDQEKLLCQLEQLNANDVLFVNGSLPKGIDGSILLKISEVSLKNGFKLVWDISHPILKELVEYKPYLIKPNIDEFRKIFLKEDAINDEKVIEKAKSLVSKGVENILISTGEKGAWFVDESMVLESNAPSGKVVNTACSGDTLLATFYATYQASGDAKYSLKKAVAAGSSTAFRPGLTDFTDVESLMGNITVSNHKQEGV